MPPGGNYSAYGFSLSGSEVSFGRDLRAASQLPRLSVTQAFAPTVLFNAFTYTVFTTM